MNVGLPSESFNALQMSPILNDCGAPGAPKLDSTVPLPTRGVLPSGELLKNSPPLQSLKENTLAPKLHETNGATAVESDTLPSIMINEHGPTIPPSSPSVTNPTLPSTPPTHLQTPDLSLSQLVVIPPVSRSTIPLPGPHRQNNVSPPLTPEDEDADRVNNGAKISSAASPDVNHLLFDQSNGGSGNVEAKQNKQLVAGMSDPSVQLRLEDELSRKDQTGTEDEASLTSGDKFGYNSDCLHTCPCTVSNEDGQLTMLETNQSLSQTIQNCSPEIPVAPIPSVGRTEESTFSNPSLAEYPPITDFECIAGVVNRRPFLGRLDPTNSSSYQHDSTVADPLPLTPASSSNKLLANKTILSDTFSEAPVISDAKLQNPDSTQHSLLMNRESQSTQPPIIANMDDIPVRNIELPADAIAQVPTAETIADQVSGTIYTENSNSRLPTLSNGYVIAARPNDDLVEVVGPSLQESVSLSVYGFDRGSSFAVIELGNEQRRKNNERARLAKVVFTGDLPNRGIQPYGANPLYLGHSSQAAKFPPGVVNFLLRGAKNQSQLLPADISASMQTTRTRAPPATSHQEHLHLAKDYLTPYFQLEAFEQPLQSLLQSSHKTLLTANHQLCVQEQQTKKVYRRIQELQEKGLWSLRQPVRSREPVRKLCHWDYLLQEAGWLSIDFKQERRFKIAQCKILADMIMEWHLAKPGHRRFLCVERSEILWSKYCRPKGSSTHNMANLDEKNCDESNIENMRVGDVSLIPPSRQSPGSHETCGDIHASQRLLPRLVDWEQAGHRPHPRQWNIGGVDTGDIFDYISTPPVQLFTLGPQETLFSIPLTNTANDILSELPLQVPPTLPMDPCILGNQEEECWQIPLAPVSKLCVARLLVNDGGPPRKRSRYEYEENYNPFADDCDSEDTAHMSTPFFSGKSCSSQPQKPVPLPPESTNVALFNPDFKHILNRMQSHHFKPPSFIPPVPFFENRLASQWLPSEDEKLKDLVQRYPQNWALISTFMTFKGDLQSAPERRSPWECFERYLQIEQPSAEFSKSPYYRGIQQRLEASGKASLSNLTSSSFPNGNGGSGSSTPTIRRRGNAPLRVERRKNSKFVHLFESMRKLAKRRELSLTKQQNGKFTLPDSGFVYLIVSAAVGAANRKAEQQSHNKPKLNNFVPAYFSKMKYEREMKIERQARENAALVAQQRVRLDLISLLSLLICFCTSCSSIPSMFTNVILRPYFLQATQSIRTHTGPPYTSSHGIPINMQRHAQPPRNSSSTRNSPVVTSTNPNPLPQVSPGTPVLRASPSVAHVLPNGIVPASGGAPVPGMAGIPLSSVTGLQGQLNGAPTANAISLGLRQHSGVPGPIHSGYTQQQIQFLKLKLAQQHQAAQAAAASQKAQNGSHSVAPVVMGSLASNYSQHAIIAAQQQAINAAASTASMKHQPNGVNSDGNNPNALSPQQRPQLNVPGPGQSGSPRPPPQTPLLATSIRHQIATWVRSQNPTLSTEQLQKLTEQRLVEYHNQIRQQLTNVQLQGTTGFSTGINGGMTTQQLYQHQQQALRQQHLIIQQQSRQGSQGPAQLPQTAIVGGVVSRGTTPQHTHILQRSSSMQSVGHSLQRTQSLGQQGLVQVQQQSPRQTHSQQAQMAGMPQVPTS